jgi:hypothetical protein
MMNASKKVRLQAKVADESVHSHLLISTIGFILV